MMNRAEVGRQIMHALIGVLLAIMYYFDILSPLAVFLGIIIGVLISFICKRVDNFPIFGWFLKHYERDEEKKNFPGKGLIFYFVGVLFCLGNWWRNHLICIQKDQRGVKNAGNMW